MSNERPHRILDQAVALYTATLGIDVKRAPQRGVGTGEIALIEDPDGSIVGLHART